MISVGLAPLSMPIKVFESIAKVSTSASSPGKAKITKSAELKDVKFGWLEWDKGILFSVPSTLIRNTLTLYTSENASLVYRDGNISILPASGNGLISSNEEWLVISTIGAGQCKDLAVKDPYRSLKLNPFITIFTRVLQDDELNDLSHPMDVGRLCCGPAVLCSSGLPFHIEAPFIQITHDRSIPLNPYFASANAPSQPARNVKLERKGASVTANFTDIQNWNTAVILSVLELLLPRVLLQLKASAGSAGASSSSSKTASGKDSGVANVGSAGFYKYWPFSSRMTNDMLMVATQSQLGIILSRMQIFLTGSSSGYTSLDRVILPVYDLPKTAVEFVAGSYPLAQTPVQVAKDMFSAGLRPNSLTPVRMRDVMKADAAVICNRLIHRLDIILPLLQYAMSDITARQPDGEFEKRKLYKEIAGFPLMLMADGSIKPFPRSDRERCFIAPTTLHRLFSSLGVRNKFVHPYLLEKFKMFDDPVFLDTIFVTKASVGLVDEIAPSIFPPSWKRCPALGDWDVAVGSIQAAASGTSSAVSVALISELVMFILWHEILSRESAVAFDALSNWPIVPVLSRGSRMLLAPEFLPHVFCLDSTSEQDRHREMLRNQSNELSDSAMAELNQQLSHMEVAGLDGKVGWKWVASRCCSRNPIKHTLPPVVQSQSSQPVATDILTEKPVLATETGANSNAASASTSEKIKHPSSDETESSSASNPSAAEIAVPATVLPSASSAAAAGSAPTAAVTAVVTSTNIPTIPAALRHVVIKLGLPIIDANIFEGPPASVATARSGDNGSQTSYIGRKLLSSIAALMDHNVVVHHANSILDVVPKCSMLHFDELNKIERQELLLEIFKAHRNFQFNQAEIDKFKTLRLFTERGSSQRAVSISDCRGGVYWCASDAALEGIPLPSGISDMASSANSSSSASAKTMSAMFASFLGHSSKSSASSSASSSAAVAATSTGDDVSDDDGLLNNSTPTSVAGAIDTPVILVNDTALRDIYYLLGVPELTATVAIKKFTVPLLNSSPPQERMTMMMSLSRK
jgi:hypothetical protein